MRGRAAIHRCVALVASTASVIAITASCGSGVAVVSGEGGPGEGGPDEGGIATLEGGESSLPLDATFDAPPPADAPFPCGATNCRVDQYCLQPCCGGPAPLCEGKNDAGGCPAGFHSGFCNTTGGEGCVMDNCVPAPASCIDNPQTQGTGCSSRNSSRYLVCECA